MRHPLARLALLCALACLHACDDGGDDATDGGATGRRDGGNAGSSGDAGSASQVVRDPAPDLTMPGEYGCDGCPDANLEEFELEVAEDTSLSFTGLVTGAGGPGEFYLESEAGQRIAGLIPTDGAGAYGFTVPLFCGTQLLKLLWSNDAGTYTAVLEIVTTDCLEADLRVTLSWDDQGRDFELHLVRPGGRINDPEDDCTWNTCMGGALDWGVPGDETDNPRKDVDNTGGFGPENVFLVDPEEGTYTVMIEHWSTGGSHEADGFVTINLLDREALTIPITNLAPHHVFTAATIEWPSKDVTVIGETYDCTDEWLGGCEAELP